MDESLVRRYVDFKETEASSTPPLLISVISCNLSLVMTLIDAGANVNEEDDCGNTALINLLKNSRMSGSEEQLLKCVKVLTDHGADVNHITKDNKFPLLFSILRRFTTVMHHLVQLGADVNSLDERNVPIRMTAAETLNDEIKRTPLHLCIAIGWEPGFQILLNAGADINVKDIHGYCAIHYAARCQNEYFLRYLLTRHNTLPSDKETQSKTHIELQIQENFELNSQNMSNATALLNPSVTSNINDNVNTLIKAGCDLNIQTNTGMTPLLVALADGLDSVANILLEAGADINRTSESGESAFHLASQNNCCEAFHFLIKLGVDIHEINVRGQTVLNYAPNIKLFEELVDMGLDKHHKDNSGFTPLHTAARKGNAEVVQYILNQGEDVNAVTDFGDTPLILAAAADKSKVIMVLYDFGADVNKQNNNGETALLASSICRKTFYNDFSFNALLQFGPNLDTQDNSGSTALIYLSQINKGKVPFELILILEKGANPNIKNKEGKSALMYSISFGFGQVSKTLLEFGADPEIGDLTINELFDMTKQASRFLDDCDILRLFLCNGIVLSINSKLCTPILFDYMLPKLQMSQVRYLLANCCLGPRDLKILRSFDATMVIQTARWTGRSRLGEKSIDNDLLMRCRCEPWPLVKLAFITVSTLIGDPPDRQRRLDKTSLPVKLQEMLMFRTPLARLPVKEWPSIPLCFDPIKYERLPKPRPLLYYWPVGKAYY